MLLKTFAVSVAMLAALAVAPVRAETPGVSESEIKVGATFPFSGPASPLSNTGKGLIAYVHSVNDRGGVNGRKINSSPMTMPTRRPRPWSRPAS